MVHVPKAWPGLSHTEDHHDCTVRNHNPFASSQWLISTFTRFIDLVIHYVCRSITMAQSRAITHAADEDRMVTIPIVFIGGYVSFLSGSLHLTLNTPV